MLQITPIPAFEDNYIWACCQPGSPFCLIVDPGDADAVQHFLTTENKILHAILVTHHHRDHIAGIAALRRAFPEVRVIGPKAEVSRIADLNEWVSDGDEVDITKLDIRFKVSAVPGHTLGHIAFYSAPVLFCGDTLFSVGCGRLFEGSPQQMWQSLTLLQSLPDDTLVYCSHEYTLANIRFALTVEPNNQDLLEYAALCQTLRQQSQPTLPALLAKEKQVNPFLRCNNKDLQQAWRQGSALELFTAIRRAKDQFTG
ncbi:hydroxyacylglutathione hydrolase [Rheinheimera muenzenbergensis]|uniref:Hydroxyacylglutathione hydrolase n=1 Tax=Rheinheimera muenzenbergensis TaxID=1193628 RepID=A0ABU8C7E1_9GAMM